MNSRSGIATASRDTAAASIAEELGAFVAGFRLADAPDREALLERARWHLLDAVGLSYLGWTARDDFAGMLLRSQGAIDGPCTVIGSGARLPAANAAFVNAAIAHGWDFDDFDPFTAMHCESFAVASTLAIAEEMGSSGVELAEALILAIEVSLRLAAAPGTEAGLLRFGFHSTSIFGTFGAAAGAAKLLGLDAEASAFALALAVSFASGTAEGWNRGSGRNKLAQVGWATQSGVAAARLAASGYTTSVETIDGPLGLYHAHTAGGDWDRDRVLEGLGEHWRTHDLAIKLFPCGGIGQATAECMQELHRVGVDPDDVIDGVISMPDWLEIPLAQIGPQLHRPTNGSSSIGAVAVIAARTLIAGRWGTDHMTDEAVRDPDVLALADRLKIVLDHDNGHLPQEERPVTVRLNTKNGPVAHSVGHGAGSPSRLTYERLTQKFRENTDASIDGQQAERIEQAIAGLDALDDVRDLTALLSTRTIA